MRTNLSASSSTSPERAEDSLCDLTGVSGLDRNCCLAARPDEVAGHGSVGLRPPKARASQGGPRQRMLFNVDPASGLGYATTDQPLIQHWWRDCGSEYQLWGALATGSA